MVELRYVIRPGWDGPEKHLQYRTKVERTKYDTITSNGSRLVTTEWTEWQYVETVDLTKTGEE